MVTKQSSLETPVPAQRQPVEGGSTGLEQRFRAQFGRPTGTLGWLVGHLMALKNRKRSEWVLSLLDLKPTDRVLEVGFGSGADVFRASQTAAFVAGVDHSEVMVRQARRRNAAAVRVGEVVLQLGSASQLPYPDKSFDKIFCINVALFWKDPVQEIRELGRVLKPGGLVAVAVQPRTKGATEETSRETGRKLVDALSEAGFSQVRLETKPLEPVSVVCALGVKP